MSLIDFATVILGLAVGIIVTWSIFAIGRRNSAGTLIRRVVGGNRDNI